MKLNSEQVKKVARLANLNLTEDELSIYSGQLSKIIEYIDQLNTVETGNVPPTFNISEELQVLRSDEVNPSLTQEQALFNAPNKDKGFFVTKGVFEG